MKTKIYGDNAKLPYFPKLVNNKIRINMYMRSTHRYFIQYKGYIYIAFKSSFYLSKV